MPAVKDINDTIINDCFFAELISNFESNFCAETLKGYNFMLRAMFHFLSNMKKSHML